MGFPVVDTVTPDRGPKAGGTSVTIVGRNFTGTSSVSFNGVPATSFSVVDDNTITAVSPAGTVVGDIDVDIVNADGTSAGAIILNDSSGNAHNGSYLSHAFVPGLVPGGDAGDSAAFTIADAIIDPAGAFTVEYWASSPAAAVGINASSADSGLTVAGPVTDVSLDGVVQMFVGGVGGWLSGFNSESVSGHEAPFPVDSAPHHLVLVYEPTGPTSSDVSLYIDGTFIASQTSSGTPGGAGAGTPMAVTASGAQHGATIDELAFYPSALSGGDVAANFAAASTSYAAYGAQVLSLSPTGFYRFDDDRKSGDFTYLSPEGWHVGRIGVGAI